MSRDNVFVPESRVPREPGLLRGGLWRGGLGKPRSPRIGLVLLIVTVMMAPAQAATVTDFASCRTLAEQAPTEALPAAQAWLDHGGGDAARLCRAEALFLHGDFAPAGEAFEVLAGGSVGRTAAQSANLYDRAGLSWLRAGDTARAERLITSGLDKLPGDSDLLIDRALARAEGKRYRDAIDDLSLALKSTPRRAEIYLYRAEAYLATKQLDQAMADVDHVATLKPGDGEALVLRGTLHALSGDTTGARLDWREVIRREPESINGKTAAARLSRLDQAPAAPAHASAPATAPPTTDGKAVAPAPR